MFELAVSDHHRRRVLAARLAQRQAAAVALPPADPHVLVNGRDPPVAPPPIDRSIEPRMPGLPPLPARTVGPDAAAAR